MKTSYIKNNVRKGETFHKRKAKLWLYVFLIPGLLIILVFCYFPMYGIFTAFQDFNPIVGISRSKWVGMKNFIQLFQSDNFRKIFINSISINVLRLVWGFPIPIIVSILFNELNWKRFNSISQTILYMPHFISWVVLSGIVMNILSPSNGILNQIIEMFGKKPIAFLSEPAYFRSILVISDIWKETGWGTIVYLAAISAIDGDLYEASKIDGAGMLKRIWYITLPCIRTTIIVLLILRLGSVLRNGFEQIFMLYTPVVYDVADVFETFTYRMGIGSGKFSFATAVGLFQSVIGLILVLITNKLAQKFGEGGLW